MDFEWDETKYLTNVEKHKVGLEIAYVFDWRQAKAFQDLRRDYGEDRFIAYGHATDGNAYVIVYTVRSGNYRIISARPFGRKDYAIYDAL